MTSYPSINSVAVVGAGTMGHGIAQVFAQADYEVVINDVDEEALSTGLDNIEESLRKIDQADPESVLKRIETTTDNESAFTDADLIVEAVPEDIDLKKNVFDDIDENAPSDAILATNTSTLPITEIAEATDRPEQVVGMHFSSPVQMMPILEIIRGKETSDETFETAQRIGDDIGKTPILVEEDVPGFLINRINVRFWLEAIRQVDEGTQDKETIDAAIQRIGFPMGPFEVMDFAGVDILEMAASSMRERNVQLHIPDLLTEIVENGRYGMKTGEGFYEYPEAGEYVRVEIPRDQRYNFDPKELIAPAVNEAAWLLENDVTTKSEIDKSVQIGMNWPRGLLEFADEYGVDEIVDTLESLKKRTGWEEYEPHPLLREMVENDRLGLATGTGFYDYEYEKEEFNTVIYERREYTAWITLNRPDSLNALDEATWEGLRTALQRAASDDAVRATVLRGAGRAFCAGDDIAELLSWESIEDASEMVNELLNPTIQEIREHPKPLIASVDGLANGGGCEIVILSDLAVASEDSDFALPEAQIGALPPLALTYGRTSLGKKSIMELAFTNEQISAKRAEEMGIVNYTVDSAQLEDVVRELVRQTTSSPPGSINKMKELWVNMEDDLLDRWIDEGLEALIERTQSEEAREGLQAFVDKESPSWVR